MEVDYAVKWFSINREEVRVVCAKRCKLDMKNGVLQICEEIHRYDGTGRKVGSYP